MDKETLSNYGWIVICVLVLAVMIALAGPFGSFVADAVKSTTQGLFDVNQNALDAAGIEIDDNAFVEGENGGSDTETTPLKFGEKYICTTDNTNVEPSLVGTYYIIFYADGSGIETGTETPEGTFTYTETEITMLEQESGLKVLISADGTTITFTNGEVAIVCTLESAIQ